MQREQLSRRPRKHSGIGKRFWSAAGFAPAKPGDEAAGLEGRRDENVGDERPWRERLHEGKKQLTPALEQPCCEPWRDMEDGRRCVVGAVMQGGTTRVRYTENTTHRAR